MNNPMIGECELAAYLSWSKRHAAPAYLQGRPTWVWQAAMCRRKARRLAAVAD